MKRTNFENNSFGDRELLSFVCFPLRGEQETAMEDLTRREDERKRSKSTTKQDFFGETLLSKTTRLTSLAFMRLIPGANRIVRHICIRCMYDQVSHGYHG